MATMRGGQASDGGYIHVGSIYTELPSDIAYLDAEVPGTPLELAEPASDPERLRSCAGAIAGRLSQAKPPAILVDQDVDRYGAAAEVGAGRATADAGSGDRPGEGGNRRDVPVLRRHLQRQGKRSAHP